MMKYCHNCKIQFNTKDKYCPLCKSELNGKCEKLAFPVNISYKTNSLLLKLLLFISITSVLISFFVELMIKTNFRTTIYIALGLFTNYLMTYHILRNYQNIIKMFCRYGFTIIFILTIWYLFTKNVFLVNYIIPSICIIELLFNIVIAIVIKVMHRVVKSNYLLSNIPLLAIPGIFLLFNQVTIPILSYVCLLLAVITSVALIVFFRHDVKEEFRKVFNI